MLNRVDASKATAARSDVGRDNFYCIDMKRDSELIAAIPASDAHDEVTRSSHINAGLHVLYKLKAEFIETCSSLDP